MERIKVVGLCGRSGSGKGYVSSRFFECGIPSIDTDRVYRESVLSGPCLCEIVSEFGDSVLNEEGRLDRRSLAAIVFAPGCEEKLVRLNEITHKYILQETLKLIERYEAEGHRSVIIDAPVLFESGFDKICDLKVCVTAPREVSVMRICERDSRSREEAERRLDSQIDESELVLMCDEAIVNDGESDVCVRVRQIIDKYRL